MRSGHFKWCIVVLFFWTIHDGYPLASWTASLLFPSRLQIASFWPNRLIRCNLYTQKHIQASMKTCSYVCTKGTCGSFSLSEYIFELVQVTRVRSAFNSLPTTWRRPKADLINASDEDDSWCLWQMGMNIASSKLVLPLHWVFSCDASTIKLFRFG